MERNLTQIKRSVVDTVDLISNPEWASNLRHYIVWVKLLIHSPNSTLYSLVSGMDKQFILHFTEHMITYRC